MIDQEKQILAAVKAGCSAADYHLTCSYPDCRCKQTPVAIKAALAAADAVTAESHWLAPRRVYYPEIEFKTATALYQAIVDWRPVGGFVPKQFRNKDVEIADMEEMFEAIYKVFRDIYLAGPVKSQDRKAS